MQARNFLFILLFLLSACASKDICDIYESYGITGSSSIKIEQRKDGEFICILECETRTKKCYGPFEKREKKNGQS